VLKVLKVFIGVSGKIRGLPEDGSAPATLGSPGPGQGAQGAHQLKQLKPSLEDGGTAPDDGFVASLQRILARSFFADGSVECFPPQN